MTSAPITLHTGPAASFDDPFAMLEACHERVQRMLGLLQRLQSHLQDKGDDPSARQAARDVMRYFDQAAPHHHQDEERHVFPALLTSGDAALAALARRLQQEHRDMVVAWDGVRPGLQALSEGSWDAPQAAQLFARWQAFATLYAGHARVEDDLAYPAARARLGAELRAAMGEEMARRRGLR